MKTNNNYRNQHVHSRGVALVTALLFLALFTVMTLSMVIATTSDTLINGYYRNSRGSFYAADSGLNSARQYLINQFAASVPNPYTAFSTTVPISAGTETTILSNLNNSSTGFGAYRSVIGSQTASWPGQFIVDSANTTLAASVPACTIHYSVLTGTLPTCTNAGNGSATYYQYSYPYKITVIGQSRTNETNTIEEQGTILLTVTIHATSSTTTNFAAWGMFIDQSPICNGSTLVPGTITGPVFTNGAWNFGTSGSYIFTDQVGSASSNLGYQFSNCYQSPNQSYSNGGQNIIPTFQSGISLGQSPITLPANSFNQEEAILDGVGDGTVIPASQIATQMKSILRDANATVYPNTPPSSGVYLPYFNNSGTMTFGTAPVSPATTPGCGGGIYVEGDASITVTAGTVTATSSPQIYTITQGSTVTTVTVDTLANTTKFKKGSGTTQTITGVPQQCGSSGTVTRDATMLYVDGDITGLKGGGEGVGAVQDTTALTIVANGDVTVTGDLLYVHEPVTESQSGSTPADTLIPANNHGQTLGIFTANGNVNLANTQSDTNLEIDASIAAINSNGSNYGLVNTGNSINKLSIVGGRIQNTIQNIGATTRNVWFDRRYAQGGFSPPWFPSTTVTASATYSAPVPAVSASRTSWVNTTAQ